MYAFALQWLKRLAVLVKLGSQTRICRQVMALFMHDICTTQAQLKGFNAIRLVQMLVVLQSIERYKCNTALLNEMYSKPAVLAWP
jgi:hypothetical protein